MSEVLVLVDHADGKVRKSTLELLAFARRIGTPVAVFVGDAAAGEAAATTLGEHGAEKVLVASDPAYGEYLVAAHAELLAALVQERQPAAVIVTAGA